MKIFDSCCLSNLNIEAKNSPRRRQHLNIHLGYQDACQRLMNAIEPDSYIRPHRHLSGSRDELLVAIRGMMALVIFNDQGDLISVVRFGTEKYGRDITVGVEINPNTWHSVVALEPGCILLEIKAGPYDPCQSKDLAAWSPEEGTVETKNYLIRLNQLINSMQ